MEGGWVVDTQPNRILLIFEAGVLKYYSKRMFLEDNWRASSRLSKKKKLRRLRREFIVIFKDLSLNWLIRINNSEILFIEKIMRVLDNKLCYSCKNHKFIFYLHEESFDLKIKRAPSWDKVQYTSRPLLRHFLSRIFDDCPGKQDLKLHHNSKLYERIREKGYTGVLSNAIRAGARRPSKKDVWGFLWICWKIQLRSLKAISKRIYKGRQQESRWRNKAVIAGKESIESRQGAYCLAQRFLWVFKGFT